jgi:hypothetical protein
MVVEDSVLQRLYSMFPSGVPGQGLLLLRVVAGILLMHDGFTGLSVNAAVAVNARQWMEALAGLFLVIGLLTPLAGGLVLLIQLWILFTGAERISTAIPLATFGAALAMLGPGSISIDALLFGRKRIEIRQR